MNLRHLLRFARWARNPPSERRVVLFIAIVVVCLGLAGLEWAGLLPDWFSLTPRAQSPRPQPLN